MGVIAQVCNPKIQGQVSGVKSPSTIYQVQSQPELHEILPREVNPKTRGYWYYDTSIWNIIWWKKWMELFTCLYLKKSLTYPCVCIKYFSRSDPGCTVEQTQQSEEHFHRGRGVQRTETYSHECTHCLLSFLPTDYISCTHWKITVQNLLKNIFFLKMKISSLGYSWWGVRNFQRW